MSVPVGQQLLVAFSVLTPLAPALAQDLAGAAAADIIVTATKRPEDIQDVPVSEIAVTEQSLRQAIVRDFDDLPRLVPSVTITKTTQPANNSINIRGVGTYAFSIAARPSVAVLVDDVPLGAQAQAFRPLSDAALVEVLRGPQSTLFGTSASAGAILITTRAPTNRLSASADLLVTNDGEQRVSGSISGPVAPGLRLRVSGGVSHYRGNLFNIASRQWVGGDRDASLRATLRWEPFPALTLTFAPYWSGNQSSCCTWGYLFLSPGVTFGRFQGFAAPQTAILNGITPGPNNRKISADVDPKGDGRDYGGSLKVEHRGPEGTFTWISAIDRYRLLDLQDTDGTAFNWGPGGAGVKDAVRGGSANGGRFDFHSLTEEVKLVSPDAARVRYVIGLYFDRVWADRDFVRGTNDLQRDGTLTIVPPTTSAFASFAAVSEMKDLALYGQASTALARGVQLLAGLRLNRETIRYRFADRVSGVNFGEPACSSRTPSGVAISTCDRFEAVSGRAALEYRPARETMIFAAYDRGYKGAAYDLSSTLTMRGPVTAPGPFSGLPIADAVTANQPIAPETVDAVQLGLKSRPTTWLTTNFTLFSETVHGFQAQSRDELTRQNILNSIPKLTTKGVELEVTAAVNPDTELQLFGAYTDARIRKFSNAPCFAAQTTALGCIGGQQNLGGVPLFQAPKWNLTASVARKERLSDRLSVRLGANWHWQSRAYQSLLLDPQSLQPAYGILNLSAGIESSWWSMRAFCTNVLDRSFALTRSRDTNWNINPYGAIAGPVSDAVRWTPARDSRRYFGLALSAHY